MATVDASTINPPPLPQPKPSRTPMSSGTLKFIGVLCVMIGIWASWVTWRFFVHGAGALEADPFVRDISIAAATMFIVGEMAAFYLANTLPPEKLQKHIQMLTFFTIAMLVFECGTIILVQTGIGKSADYHAKALDTKAELLKDRIESKKSASKTLREAGTTTQKAWWEKGSGQAGIDAARESLATEREMDAQAAELANAMLERKPTTTELLGETGSMVYAVVRGILITVSGLVFFGTAGALFKLARDRDTPQSNLDAARATAAGLAVAGAATLGTAAPTPAEAAPHPHQAQTTQTTDAPAQDASKSTHPGASKPTHSLDEQAASTTATATEAPAPNASKPTHPGASVSTQQTDAPTTDAPKTKPRKPRNSTALAAGVKADTGVEEHNGHRYRAVRAEVAAGQLAPGLNAIQSKFGGSAPVVRNWLEQMSKEGLITRTSKTYKLTQQQLV